MSAEIEIGKIYKGRVVTIKEFGAFVEVFPGQDGLVHVSELSDKRVARVEDHPIARLKRCHQPDGHLLALDATDFAQVNSPLLAKASMGQFLVVHPSEPSRVKPPRESHFQSIPRLRPDLLHG